MGYTAIWAEASYAAAHASAVTAEQANEELAPEELLADTEHAVMIDADGGGGLVLYGTRGDLLDALDEIRRKLVAAPENRPVQS